MDQYDGRFEYDNHAFEGLMDVEPRPRHKEAVHSRHNHGADAGKARHKGGKKSRWHQVLIEGCVYVGGLVGRGESTAF